MSKVKNAEVVNALRTIPNRSVQAQQLEERLRTMEVGESIPNADLNTLIHGDVQGKERGFLTTARKRLLAEGIVVEVVRNVGVKREDEVGKVACVNSSRSRVRRAARKGLKYAVTVDRAQLPATDAMALDLNAACLAMTLNITSSDGMAKIGKTPQQGAIPAGVTVPKV